MLWNAKKPNEKLQSYVIIFLWDVIYVHFYNWDRPPDLVLVVYNLIELINEVSLWTKDYSTFDTHTHTTHKIFVQWMLISFVWLYMFKCDVCVLNHIWIKRKRFLFFLFAFESNLYHPCFSNCFGVKNMFSRCFRDLFHV